MTTALPTISLADARRGRKRWSQRDLAVASSVPLGTIAAAEAGRIRLPERHREAITRALGITPAEAHRVKELA